MSDAPLPVGWLRPDDRNAAQLARQFARELSPRHPLAAAQWQVLAQHQSDDTVVVEAAGLTPRYYLLHLEWSDGPPREPHEIDALDDLPGIMEPPEDTVDDVSFWTRSDTETGLVFVQHLLNGVELVEPLDWPADAPPPADTAALAAAGWRQITGRLTPKARDGWQLIPTGQWVEHWVRPVLDNFVLFRAIFTPGDGITVRQMFPPSDHLVHFDTEDDLSDRMTYWMCCRATSPMSPRYGLAGYPADWRKPG